MAAILSPAQTVSSSLPPPDVYLITIDTLRADHVHCYGYNRIQTPALDGLAREGVRFAQAFTPSPLTNTSHTSILTGLLPSVHGVTGFAMPLPKTFPTWAELLHQHGYQTAAFIAAVVLDSRTLAPGLDRGFDYYDNFPPDPAEGKHWGRVERRGDDVVHRAETWMDAHSQTPRFVWVHLYDPHDPYEPPPPYSKIYKDQLYDGEIAYADAALGNMLSYLKRANRYQNALMIVVGDHGEGLGEHGEQTHGIFLYDATTHVPLIVKLPVKLQMIAQADKVVDAQVQTTDILPTVLDLLRMAPPPAFGKRSLRGYLTGTSESDRVVFGETDYPLNFGWAPLRAVRAGGFKFIEAPRPELYDVRKDPAELSNEYEPWNPTVQHLRSEMASSAMRPPHVSPATGTARSTTLSELSALGYLGPNDNNTATNVPEFSSLPDPKDKIEEQNLLHSAMMLVSQGRSAEAQLLLEKNLLLNPDSPVALRQLGELEFDSGEYRRARKALEAAVTQSPGEVDARLLLARIDLKSGDRVAAEDQFEAVLLLDANNRDALLSLAKAHLQEKRFADVVELLEPRLHSASVDELQLLVRAYAGLGRTADANRVRALSLGHGVP